MSLDRGYECRNIITYGDETDRRPPELEVVIKYKALEVGNILIFYSVIYFGMTITRAENVCLPQRSTELIALAENTSESSIWFLYESVQMSTAESKLRPSLTRERKKLNSQKNRKHYFTTGDRKIT